MSTAVGFSPATPGNSVITGGVTATAGVEGDSPLGFLDALLGLLAQGTALTPEGQPSAGGEDEAKPNTETLASLGFAAETAISTQLPVVETPVIDVEAEPAVDGEQLLEDLVAALTAIEDAAEKGEPVDPALHKKLSETLDDIAGLLGITLPSPPTIDPVITAAAGGDIAVPSTVELSTGLVMEANPPPPGFTIEPADSETVAAPATDLAAKFAEAVEQVTTPAQVEDETKPEAAPTTGDTAETEAEIDPESPLGKLVAKLSDLAEKLAAVSPELSTKLEAVVQKLTSKTVDAETLAQLSADLDAADVDLLVATKPDAKPAPAPQVFTAPTLPAPASIVLPPRQTGEAPKVTVEPKPVEKPEAKPEEARPDDIRVAKETKPAERSEAEPKVRERGSFAAHLAETRGEKAEPAQQAQAQTPAAPVKPEAAVVPPKAVHAAYQAPVQQINMPQVAFEVVRQFSQGHSRFQIRLDPPELGRIDVRMQVDGDGNVHARLTVERSETLDLMQRDQRSLEKALAQAGLDSGKTNLEFSLRQNPFARDGQGQQQHQGGNGSPFASHRAAASDEVPEITSTTTQYRGLATASGVNLFV